MMVRLGAGYDAMLVTCPHNNILAFKRNNQMIHPSSFLISDLLFFSQEIVISPDSYSSTGHPCSVDV